MGDVLSFRRRSRFVGRKAEIELVKACLDAEVSPFSVLYLHGPGGIGKSSLLDALAVEAVKSGVRVAAIDGRDILVTPDAVTTAIREALSAPDGSPSGRRASPTSTGRAMLLVDSYERLVSLDDWIRRELIPGLPADTLIILAGRVPPGTGWRSDPAWQGLLRVVALRNLPRDEALEFLGRCAVPPILHSRVLALSHGHPLGLSLLADLALRVGDVDVGSSPDLIAGLLERFLDTVPEQTERQALLACALARVTTEPLLRAALAVDDAREWFDWLRGLSFVEAGPDGLLPHDLARDVIDRDLRWRDPEGYRLVFRRVRAHIHDQVVTLRGDDQLRGIFEEKFVFRNLPSILSPVDWSSWGSTLPRPASRTDRTAVLELIDRHEGTGSAAIAERWFDQQPGAFLVVRKDSAVTGVIGLLDLSEASEEDRAADPGAQAAWEHVQAAADIHPGQRVTQTRFIVDSEVYQAPSATLNAVPIVTLQRYLAMPELAWDFLTLHEPDPWDDYFALADLPRIEGADFQVGRRSYGLFGHDFRAVPIGVMMELWTERSLAEDPTVPPPTTAGPLMLSQSDFADAVRQGLRDLDRPDLLARNPLQRTRLVAGAVPVDQPDPDRLADLLRAAITDLTADPRNDKRHRAVELTYLRGSRTQESRSGSPEHAVQHLSPAPHPRRRPRRLLVLETGDLWPRRPGPPTE